ncbi:phosphoribosylglycinamide formyltransferase, partial [Escherichia coli]|uniref:phosphoribosylglycinamide formyltransferase n=1 Tax=Escherichia coli TaxID=562 RepID=UPI0024C19125
ADGFGLERARQAGIATHTLIASAFDSREAYDRELIHEIDMYAPDVVVLAGFMRILSPAFVSHYAGRLLNIHPSLLPKYPGLHTHRQALENG